MKKKDRQAAQLRAAKAQIRMAHYLIIAVVAFMVAAGVALAFWGMYYQRGQMLNNTYSKSLYEVEDNISNIETRLSKLSVSTDNFESALLINDVWRQTDNAASNLAQIPLQHDSIARTTKFVNQLGEYSYSLGKKLAAGGTLTDAEKDTLENLWDNCRGVKEGLSDLTAKVNSGYRIITRVNPNKKADPISSGFSELEKNSVDYPKMIFDGPFSDSTENRNYRAIKELDEITSAQGEEKIKSMLAVSGIKKVNYLGEAGGDLRTYEYTVDAEGGEYYVQLTKKGGRFLMIDSDKNISFTELSDEQAAEAAERAAEQMGFENMRAVWVNTLGNTGYVNLAYFEDGIAVYPDLVKVKIALDDGSILGLESTAYLCNHKQGRETKATISTNTARNALSSKLTEKSNRLAVIPKNDREILCYEFVCAYKDFEYYIYIDAYNGKQTEIQRVVDSAQGKVLN